MTDKDADQKVVDIDQKVVDARPREFWICGHRTPTGNFMSTWVTKNKPKRLPENHADIHVIEKSAYDTLKAQAEKLAEALAKIAEDFGTDYCDGNCLLAHETLAEHRKGKA
jgi:hypothetical protein